MLLIGYLPSFFGVALRAGVTCLKLLTEDMMKGRRKVVTHRWSLQSQFKAKAKAEAEAEAEAEVRRTLAKRSKKDAQRFLDAALVFGRSFEPTGRLAGGSSARQVQDTPS
jgi:hypothetical protein